MGYSELLKIQTSLDENQEKYLSMIEDASKRAQALTQRLLMFSRKQNVKPEALNWNEQIEAALKMYRRLIGENVEVIFRPLEKLPMVMADSQQLDQLLANLLINARDAMDVQLDTDKPRQIIIETSIEKVNKYEKAVVEQEGEFVENYVCLEVIDKGVGMDEETKEKIFEPFFTTKGKGKGTGLGLSTVFGVVQQNNGVIDVESTLGEGTKIKILWPVIQGDETASEVSIQGDSLLPKGSETILLVEDEANIRELATQVLTDKGGYQVVAAESGEEALGVLATKNIHPDLLVTDVVLPGMNGKQLADSITILLPEIGVIYTSGYTDDIISKYGVLDGDIEMIEKPYGVITLLEKVREALDRQ